MWKQTIHALLTHFTFSLKAEESTERQDQIEKSLGIDILAAMVAKLTSLGVKNTPSFPLGCLTSPSIWVQVVTRWNPDAPDPCNTAEWIRAWLTDVGFVSWWEMDQLLLNKPPWFLMYMGGERCISGAEKVKFSSQIFICKSQGLHFCF